jgi:FtsP/CotA-like multicopper oxidase with cupredoxin domain
VRGLHVSPEGAGDNVFVTVDPGASFGYEYRLPLDHPPGVYWYRHHGTVANQIFAGLFGAIIVEDPEPIPVRTERVLVISDTTLDGGGNAIRVSQMERMLGREGELILVNGQSTPEFKAKPGGRERWRIINAVWPAISSCCSTGSSCSCSEWIRAGTAPRGLWRNGSWPPATGRTCW